MNRFYCIHCVADIFICKRYLQHYNYLFIRLLLIFYCRWQIDVILFNFYRGLLKTHRSHKIIYQIFNFLSCRIQGNNTCLTCFRAEQHRELPNQYWTSFILYRLHTHYITLINHFLMSIEDRKIISIQLCITP